MDNVCIRAEGLGKRYRIGEIQHYKALRDTISDAFAKPFRNAVSMMQGRKTAEAGQEPDNTIWALKDISFEIRHGEVVGIIGRNGAGKSTLLKILSRITEPTEGRATLFGRVGSLLEVGTGFHPELTGRENIYLNGAILGMKKAEISRKFDEIVSFAEVEKFIDTPVKFYSSGMYVRLAFGVAAHLEPEILLVDEVLAVGDAEFQKKCIGKMEQVAKEGRTVLFVSHNMPSLLSLCTRGILLEPGRIGMQGGIAEVVAKYLDTHEEQHGEVSWKSPQEAPGDHRARLKAVRVVSRGLVSGKVDISEDFRIEVDYWNLEPGNKFIISIHLNNSTGVCILTSANFPSASLSPDPWYDRNYPSGLFRTACTIPGNFLNDGLHTVTLYIARSVIGSSISIRDVLSFHIEDTGAMRKEFTGKWIGAVRPRLDWKTEPLAIGGNEAGRLGAEKP